MMIRVLYSLSNLAVSLISSVFGSYKTFDVVNVFSQEVSGGKQEITKLVVRNIE
jgi:hypothetical protein